MGCERGGPVPADRQPHRPHHVRAPGAVACGLLGCRMPLALRNTTPADCHPPHAHPARSERIINVSSISREPAAGAGALQGRCRQPSAGGAWDAEPLPHNPTRPPPLLHAPQCLRSWTLTTCRGRGNTGVWGTRWAMVQAPVTLPHRRWLQWACRVASSTALLPANSHCLPSPAPAGLQPVQACAQHVELYAGRQAAQGAPPRCGALHRPRRCGHQGAPCSARLLPVHRLPGLGQQPGPHGAAASHSLHTHASCPCNHAAGAAGGVGRGGAQRGHARA